MWPSHHQIGYREVMVVDRYRTDWRKSSRSGHGSDNCVEVATQDGTVMIRDSKNQSGPVLAVQGDDWASFLAAVKDKHFVFGERITV